jgi:ferredoxin-nitrite reductase
MGGRSTHLAWDLDVFVPPEDVAALCRAVLAVFRDEGSRESRLQARLKWLVESLGIEAFRARVEHRLGRPLARAGKDEVRSYGGDHTGVHRQREAGRFYVGLNVPVGRTTADDLIGLAKLALLTGSGNLRLTNDQNVLIPDVDEADLDAFLSEPLLLKYQVVPPSLMRRLVSCTGKDFCHFSLIDTKGRALEVAERLQVLLPGAGPLRMHWSGCPHACGLHHIGDIGIQAARVRVGSEVVDAADVFMGGRLGTDPRLAAKVLEGVPIDELPQRLRDLLAAHPEYSAAGGPRQMAGVMA